MFGKIRSAILDRSARRAFERRVDQGYRIVKISFPNRIGHQIVEIDCLLKNTILRGGDTKAFFLPDIGEGFANRHVVDYYKRYLTVEPDSGVARYIADPAHEADPGIVATHPYAVAMYAAAGCYDVYTRWGDRPALFEPTQEDVAAGARYLRGARVPADAWYVCLHAREGGYSPADEAIHKFRSIDVQSYALAVQTITDAGGWVIRMGDATMRPFAPNARVIDYARSPEKSAQLDVALTSGCRFYLGSASGLYCLASMFARPCFVSHMAPLGGSMGMAPRDLSIPQKLRDRDGRMLALRDVMNDAASHFRLAEEFAARGLVNEPNSPEEIDEGAREMLARLDGSIRYTDDDERRQAAFRALLREDHYSWRATSRIGRDFLRRYLPL